MTPATRTAIDTLQALRAPASRITRCEAKAAADGEAAQAAIRHLWKPTEVNAITLALATRRPLLVRGEPGTGKTQLAQAAAALLGWRLHSNTLHARSEAQDLLYRFDAVRRLADAQANKWKDENEHAYWEPQALWRGLDWATAKGYGSLRAANQPPTDPAGHVVLIDEIDKAPSDVPNGLLEVLGARSFAVSGLGIQVGAPDDEWPLVIITTNEEQILPAAFLRRCVVLTHDLPEAGGYRGFLIEHGDAHFGAVAGDTAEPEKLPRSVLERAADCLVADRKNAIEENLPPPGMAEYLDLLYALHALAPGDSEKQKHWFDELNQYAFLKHRVDGEGDSRLRQDSSGRRAAPPRER